MSKTPREMAADLALAACRLLEFHKSLKNLPRLHDFRLDSAGSEVHCHIHTCYENRKGEWVRLTQDEQILALRIWARHFGADLTLGEPRRTGYADENGDIVRILSTSGELPNGLKVSVSTGLYYFAVPRTLRAPEPGEAALAVSAP